MHASSFFLRTVSNIWSKVNSIFTILFVTNEWNIRNSYFWCYIYWHLTYTFKFLCVKLSSASSYWNIQLNLFRNLSLKNKIKWNAMKIYTSHKILFIIFFLKLIPLYFMQNKNIYLWEFEDFSAFSQKCL